MNRKPAENYKFFSNRQCEYFPCHNTLNPDEFNCIFCYCPLYAMGEECGGNYRYTQDGVKDCSGCDIPHIKENYDMITQKLCDALNNNG